MSLKIGGGFTKARKHLFFILILAAVLVCPMVLQPSAAWRPSVYVRIECPDQFPDTGEIDIRVSGGSYVEVTAFYWDQSSEMWRIHPNGQESGSNEVILTLGEGSVPSAYPRPYKIIGYAYSFGAWDAKAKYINWYPEYEFTHPSHPDVLTFAEQFHLLTDPASPSTRAQQLQSIFTSLCILLDIKEPVSSEAIPKTDLEQIALYYDGKSLSACHERFVLLLSVLQALSRQGKIPLYGLEGCRFRGPASQGIDPGMEDSDDQHYFIRGSFWNGEEWVYFMADDYTPPSGFEPGWINEDPGPSPRSVFWTADEYEGWKTALVTVDYEYDNPPDPYITYPVYLFHGYASRWEEGANGYQFHKDIADFGPDWSL
jgi:hypothetical protein